MYVHSEWALRADDQSVVLHGGAGSPFSSERPVEADSGPWQRHWVARYRRRIRASSLLNHLRLYKHG